MSYGGNDLGIDPRKYGTQLATLHRMGYRDDVLNLKALESVGGDPIEALAVLSGERPMPNLNLHSTSSSTPAPKLPSRQNTAGRLPQAPAVSIPPHLRSQVAQLQDMGFTDTARVLRALTDANGKVDDALEVLLRDQSANAPSTSSNRGRQQQTSQGQRPPPPPTEPPPRPRRDVDDLLDLFTTPSPPPAYNGNVQQQGFMTGGQMGQMGGYGQGQMGQMGAMGGQMGLGQVGQMGGMGQMGSMGSLGPTGQMGPVGPMGPMGQGQMGMAQMGGGQMGQMGGGQYGQMGQTNPMGQMGQMNQMGSAGQMGAMGPTEQMGQMGQMGGIGRMGQQFPQQTSPSFGPVGSYPPQAQVQSGVVGFQQQSSGLANPFGASPNPLPYGSTSPSMPSQSPPMPAAPFPQQVQGGMGGPAPMLPSGLHIAQYSHIGGGTMGGAGTAQGQGQGGWGAQQRF